MSADIKKSAVITKFIRGITVAARESVDVSKNFKLRMALDSAKVAGVPKDTIDRALARASGEGEMLEEALYEALGPGKVGILIEAVTNNKNRTLNTLRKLLEDEGGVLGQTGTVGWQFKRLGVARLTVPKNDELEMQLIDLGAEDIKEEEGGLTIYTQVPNFQKLLEGLEKLGLKPEYQSLEWVAKEPMEVTPEEHEKLEKLYEELDEADDVQNYYTSEA